MPADISTKYLGLKLANPLVVSACPLTSEMDVLRKLEEYGAAAAVMPSLFEEQLGIKDAEHGPLESAEHSSPLVDPLAYFHTLKEYNRGPEAYLKHLTAAKRIVSIPLIGSLNATGPGEANRFARQIQEAGADALELNIYYVVTDPEMTSHDVESRYLDLVASVRGQISIPLAVKISPFFTALPNFARRLVDAGANGLVLFNRFFQPDIDLDTQRVIPRLTLSTPDEMRLPLRWTALLHGRLRASLAATSGVRFADDVIKLLLVGADVVMVASTLYQHGLEVLPTLIDGVRFWLDSNEYGSVEQIKGSLSQRRCPDPAAFERANYAQSLASFMNEGTAG